MDGSYPGNLRLWDGSAAALLPESTAVAGGVAADSSHLLDVAKELYAREALCPLTTRSAAEESAEPYSLQWFLQIENRRHGRHCRWIPRLLEFSRHAGETLLGLGNGLGTDWLQYARHGAEVVVCSPSAEHLTLVRRNFELRNLPGRFVHAGPASLPLEPASIDVACLNGPLDEVEDPATVVGEVYRVLKPGGKVLAVTAARYDVDFWFQAWFSWQRYLKFMKPKPEQPGARFSGRELRRLFDRFTEHRVQKRQLRRSEVPHLWRWLPLSVLERLMGHVLILKAFKPLSAAIPIAAAA